MAKAAGAKSIIVFDEKMSKAPLEQQNRCRKQPKASSGLCIHMPGLVKLSVKASRAGRRASRHLEILCASLQAFSPGRRCPEWRGAGAIYSLKGKLELVWPGGHGAD